MDWDHLRTVLAIGRGGTLSAAARSLGVNQTTVSRHLEAMEQRLGGALFLRLSGQLYPTDAGSVILERAARMESEAKACRHALADSQAALAGPVSLTATESILEGVVAPALGGLYQQLPAVQLELIGCHDTLSLLHREADLALRLARPQADSSEAGVLQARKLAEIGFAAYAARDAASSSCPGWLTYGAALSHVPEAQWVTAQPERVVLRASSLTSLAAAAAAGVGWAALPCYMGDQQAGLSRCERPVPVVRELWLVAHHDVLRVPRVRAVADWLIAEFAALQSVLRAGS